MPLHWFTDVTSWLEVVVVLTGPTLKGQEGNATPAAAKHAVAVTVELVAPLELTVLTTVRTQVTWSAAPLGNSGGLHCATAGGPLFVAEATVAVVRPMAASEANAIPAATATASERRTLPARDLLVARSGCMAPERKPRRELRK